MAAKNTSKVTIDLQQPEVQSVNTNDIPCGVFFVGSFTVKGKPKLHVKGDDEILELPAFETVDTYFNATVWNYRVVDVTIDVK